MRRLAAISVAAAGAGGLALALVGAGGSAGSGPRVYAASSLREVLPRIEDDARYSFAGSGQLRRQVEAGAPADVFASASPEEPAALHAQGLCTRPRPFATNRLAILVPRGRATRVDSPADLAEAGRRVALGAPAVPVGRAARTALARLGISLDRAVVSSEPSDAGVVAKVALGSADAGIGYVTDARAAAGRLRAIPLPAAAQPTIEYHVCAVQRPGAERAAARAFIDRLTGPRARGALLAAGFGPAG